MNERVLPLSPEVIAADGGRIGALALVVVGLVVAFFVLRPELWRRLAFGRIDPRPAALMRIVFGAVLLWAWLGLVPLGRELFTDEGIWLTEQARGRERMLSYLWDPQEGFEGLGGLLSALTGPFSVLQLRSDPPFVAAVWTALLVALSLMIVGLWTRVSTVVAWLLMHQLYGYSAIFFSGADNAMRTFMFLAIFLRWGEALSLDALIRKRKAIAAGATVYPASRLIPAWPQRLMVIQLAVIYGTTGWLKTGIEWRNGTALYYALNLEHFYRMPMMGIVARLQDWGVLGLFTTIVRHWELLFPVVLVGLLVRTWEKERAEGSWPASARWRKVASWTVAAALWLTFAVIAGLVAYHAWPPRRHPFGVSREGLRAVFFAVVVAVPLACGGLHFAWRRFAPVFLERALPWILGRRIWLGFGAAMHIGIALSMNVGSFSQAMLATYWVWLNGDDVERLRGWIFSRACKPGEERRPLRANAVSRWLLAPWDRLRYRCERLRHTVRYAPTGVGVRRAALLRPWDAGRRLAFEPKSSPDQELELAVAGGGILRGRVAAAALSRTFPALWWLGLLTRAPGLSGPASALALRILRQEVR